VELRDLKVLRANTERKIKATVPGPFTMGRQAHDDYYGDEEAVAMAYAEAVNAEIKDLFAAGADVVQIDEPWMQQHPEKARRYGIKTLNRALDGVAETVVVHLCFGYAAVVRDKPSGYSFLPELEQSKAQQISIEAAQPKLDLKILSELPSKTIVLGVIDLGDMTVETPRVVADRIGRAFDVVPPERIVVAPDCGMKYLPRTIAFGKMQAMADGAALVRRELSGS
jgi:5-methyltetrahydropteroyltriglutamate--homocysteine methyltransferase